MEPTSTSRPGPPPLNLDQLDCTSKLDFIKVSASKKKSTPALTGTSHWTPPKRGYRGFTLTVQDPLLTDIEVLIEHLGNPPLMGFQLTVDLMPKPAVTLADRETLLLDTFHAIAGRFRPEDEALWGYGVRGGTDGVGKKPKPFHRRFPEPHEELVYGHRGGWMQSTAYLKRTNEGTEMAPSEHRVRMELTLTRGGLMEMGLDTLGDLCGYAYRPTFTKHFRVVQEPRIRAVRSRDEVDLVKMTRRMWRAWATAGVGKFGISHEFPLDTINASKQQIIARGKQQLAASDYVLVRDQKATEKIGNALRQLQRRMTLKKARAV